MNTFRNFLLLIFSLAGLTLSAQETLVSGSVRNSDNLAPMPYVSISFAGSRTGCTSDLNGQFSIMPDTLPVYMIISHIGFETRRIWLENSANDIGLDILLKPEPKMLKEVEIKSGRAPMAFFSDDHYAVLDYVVDNTLVYLLVYRRRTDNSQLICLTDRGDTLAESGNLSFRPTCIYNDCLGYLHVFSRDTAYQVFLNKDTLLFPYKSEIRRFLSSMSDCVASSSDWLYFRKESPDHMIVDFYRISRITKKRENIASAIDAEKMNMLRYNPLDHYFLLMDTLPCTTAEIVEWVWVNKILYKANSSVLKKIGDSLTIFNTADGTLNFYDPDGKYISGLSLPVRQKGPEKWSETIYFDEYTHTPYTIYEKNGRFNLYRIDIRTGQMKYLLTSGHLFPQKVMINNNCLFYMYDNPGTADNKQLFRQKI